MTPDERLEHAAERFAASIDEAVAARVGIAVRLEHDRLYAELAELRDEVHALAHRVTTLADLGNRLALVTAELHSVKVEP